MGTLSIAARLTLFALIAAFLAGGCDGAAGPTPPASEPELPASQVHALDRFIGQFSELAMFDGVVLVDIGGEVVYRQSFGYASYELGVRHLPDHRFRIASVSKAVTDTAIARLIEPGDEPGQRRYPRFYAVESRPGGGSLYSTVDDLLLFTRALFREDFVTEEWRREALGVEGDVYLSQGRSPGFVAKLYYRKSDDVIVISLANNYAVPADWAAAIGGLAAAELAEPGWIGFEPVTATIASDHPMIGDYTNSFGGTEMSIDRSPKGHLIVTSGDESRATALIPLADGAFLMPTYFQHCRQLETGGVIECRMLSGNERYTSILTPR